MSNLATVRKLTEILEIRDGGIFGVKIVTVKRISDGKVKVYKVLNDTWYNSDTPDDLLRVLDGIFRSGTRCRFFLGDQDTGYDWAVENSTMGTIGRSTGEAKIPLLIASSKSNSGIGLSDDCIVKIVTSNGGQVLWKHPKYEKPEFRIINRGEDEFPNLPEEYVSAVFRLNDKEGKINVANFRNHLSAEGYVAFMRGERNSKAYGLKVVKK
ncbi:hypothetical protein ACFVS2_20465 [Brevibacillus sp. NPDC058079]|uniref:hypothetical protein n=1 Tax=Brevibacillus sp. NPDC058079 TaxID=3346330 RepID=UPI0036E07141